MYFDEDDRYVNPDLLQVVRREFYAVNSHLDVSPFGLKYVPTHTEDGIPIRKLYVSNLPPKTTRAELHDVFAQYGFIKSCWLRMGDRGPNRTSSATYAFVTYSNPGDAHKALQAPTHEKSLRGRHLRISPADSWHQPVEASDIHYKPKPPVKPGKPARPPPKYRLLTNFAGRITLEEIGNSENEPATGESSSHVDRAQIDTAQQPRVSAPTREESISNLLIEPCPSCEQPVAGNVSGGSRAKKGGKKSKAKKKRAAVDLRPDTPAGLPEGVTILDVLNRDCLRHILSYVPIRDLIRSERVSKTWHSMIREYLEGTRVFKTSWWQHVPVTLTTAVLRRVLQRVGCSLARLHIDHSWSALNDRTAHTIGKFCPNLEELKIVGMHTRNWNPLIYGCKQLKSLTFVSCNKLTDSSLVHLVKSETSVERLTVANNTHVTGLFLTGAYPRRLNSLSFYNCYSLQGTVLSAAMDSMPDLTVLRLDVCPHTMWKIIPMILDKLPKLRELSLSEYMSVETSYSERSNEDFCNAISKLTELRVLNISRNIYITNAIVKRIAQTCTQLESLDISGCNSRRAFPYPGVGDDAVVAVCRSCRMLHTLDVSYLSALTDGGLRAVCSLARLTRLLARGAPAVSSAGLAGCLRACHLLQELDVCGCEAVSEELVEAAAAVLFEKPRALMLRLAGTAAAAYPLEITHKLLSVDIHDDRSNPNYRPDFIDQTFEGSSDESFGDLYDHDFYDIFDPDEDDDDDDDFVDAEMDEYDELYQFRLHAPNIILL